MMAIFILNYSGLSLRDWLSFFCQQNPGDRFPIQNIGQYFFGEDFDKDGDMLRWPRRFVQIQDCSPVHSDSLQAHEETVLV